MMCDYILAAKNAKCGQLEVTVGILPEGAVARNISKPRRSVDGEIKHASGQLLVW